MLPSGELLGAETLSRLEVCYLVGSVSALQVGVHGGLSLRLPFLHPGPQDVAGRRGPLGKSLLGSTVGVSGRWG